MLIGSHLATVLVAIIALTRFTSSVFALLLASLTGAYNILHSINDATGTWWVFDLHSIPERFVIYRLFLVITIMVMRLLETAVLAVVQMLVPSLCSSSLWSERSYLHRSCYKSDCWWLAGTFNRSMSISTDWLFGSPQRNYGKRWSKRLMW